VTRRRALERDVRHELRAVRAPDEPAVAARARRAVLAAHASTPRRPARSWRRPILAAAAVIATLAVVAAGLTAPGQAVGDWLREVVRPQRHAAPVRPAPALPAGGRLLVARAGAVGVTSGAGEPRRLGAYRDATWSPSGRFAAVTTRHSLEAVTPGGSMRWSVTPPFPPRSPRWAPDGFRLAYLSGPQLRVVVGDGTDDRLFYGHVLDVPPAFRPPTGRTVAWVDRAGRARVADVDRAELLWRSPVPVPRGTRSLSWSPDGRRLLAAASRRIAVYDLGSGRVSTPPVRGRVVAAAFPPTGSGAAAVVERRGGRSAVVLLSRRHPLIETSGRYSGLAWSPDGRWLLTSWGAQWLLVRADGRGVTSLPAHGRALAWTR
jgi:WD40-like Beta Propeller Repeat